MEITITTDENGVVTVHTLDGDFSFTPVSKKDDPFSTGDEIQIKDLIKNIWNNSKIKDSSLYLEIRS